MGMAASGITFARDKKAERLASERLELETKIEKLTKLATEYPNYPDLLLRLGKLEWEAGNKEAAKKVWEKAKYLNPNSQIIREFGGFWE